jgi:hypothetical protein
MAARARKKAAEAAVQPTDKIVLPKPFERFPDDFPEFYRMATDMIDAKARESLLLAIARARGWMESIISGAKNTLDEIAVEEQLAERYVRRLSQLAFLSPKLVEAIDNGTAPAGLTVSCLIQLPYAWTDQQQVIGIT